MVIILPRHETAAANIGSSFRKGLATGTERANNRIEEEMKEAMRDKRERQKFDFAEQERANVGKFLEDEYGIKGAKNLPNDFQKEILKGEYTNKGRQLSSANKAPLGGLTGQSVPKEISQAMGHIVSLNPNANSDELKMQMDEMGIPPAYSNSYIENRRRQDERQAASKDKRLESGQKRAEKVLDEADNLGKELPILESTVTAMEDAIQNRDLSFWSADNLAEMTGLEWLRTAKGAQFKSASKNYFINDLKASGARPNMFIEKQFVDALAKIGRSEEANQTVIESFKFTNDLKKKRLDTIRDLEKYYDESLGYLPGRFNAIVEETMKPYVNDRQKDYEKRLKDIAVTEKKKSMSKSKQPKLSGKMIDVIGPDGLEYEVDQSEVELLPEGYKVR